MYIHMRTQCKAADGEVWRDTFQQLEGPGLSPSIHPAEVSLSKTLNLYQPQEYTSLADPALWLACGQG